MDEISRQSIERAIGSTSPEKTSIDKLSARGEVDRLRELMRKATLTREDVLEMHSLLASNETKFLNYSDWERYIVNLFYVWINELVSIDEEFQDFKKANQERIDERKKRTGDTKLTEKELMVLKRIEYLQTNITNQNQDTIKFLCRVYVNISRTSLSARGYFVSKLMENRWEIQYTQPKENIEEPKKMKLFG